MFLNSERGVKRLPFFLGMHELSKQMYAYETKLHAQFALFHVLLAKLKKTTAELMFLCDRDIAFVKPTEMYAMNLHDGENQKLCLPLCAYICTKSGVLALDLDQMRFIDLVGEPLVDIVNGKPAEAYGTDADQSHPPKKRRAVLLCTNP